jgi:Alpha galactosidase C-terminal beta sandwich domain
VMKVKVAALICLALAMGSSTLGQGANIETQTVKMSGKNIVVDDALFTGCFHNAFEGEIITLKDGGYKRGRQAILRTKGVLNGAGSTTSKMTLAFTLDRTPKGKVGLKIKGIDDRFEAQCPVAVTVNGKVLAKGITFPNNRCIKENLNQRYFLGWEEREVTIPAELLKKGKNTLTLANTRSIYTAERWPYAIVDSVTFAFPDKVDFKADAPPSPPFYYGLAEGVETNAWPAVNNANRISLVKGASIEYNFFATMPQNLPLGKLGPLGKKPSLQKRKIVLHVATKADIKVMTWGGTMVEPEEKDGVKTFTQPIARFVKFETPHPSQGVRLFIIAKNAFENKALDAWYSVDGVAYRKRVYPLRSVDLKPIPGRDKLDFLLSQWGSRVPKDAKARANYVALLRAAGFNHQFTGDQRELNLELKKAGFKVYPRFGWFGRKYKVTEANAKYASVDFRGKSSTRDFCPLAILDHPEEKEMGKYFKHAARYAELPNVDGICVDYETAPVWCWCDRCMATFKKQAGLEKLTRAEIGPKGSRYADYADFGRRLNSRLLTRIKEVMVAKNPNLTYQSLASAADLPTYWYDGRLRGRHAVEELVKFADNIYASHYCYEMPGGLKSVMPVVETVQRFALASGRKVKASIITPVATTVSEHPRYRGVRLRPEMTRLMILLTGAAGGGGISLFRGDCMDGDQYLACHQAISELVKLRPYIKGINRSSEAELTPEPGKRPDFDTSVAQNLLSRFVWRPDFSYQYDVVHLLKNKMGKDRAILVFNYSDGPVTFNLKVRGLYDPAYAMTNLITGKAVGEFGRLELESGKPVVTVPARDCVILRLVNTKEPQ